MIQIDEKDCVLCETKEETLKHIFIDCPLSKIIWANFPWPIRFFDMQFKSSIPFLTKLHRYYIYITIRRKFETPIRRG